MNNNNNTYTGGYLVTKPWDYNLRIAHYLLQQKNAILFDIRSYKEYSKIHLCGSINTNTHICKKEPIKLDKKEKNKLRLKFIYILTGQSLNRPLIVYSDNGIRSKIGQNILKNLGFKTVVNLGGITEYPLYNVINKNIELPYLQLCNCN
jgi:rhodanese-related sulfurtransferase